MRLAIIAAYPFELTRPARGGPFGEQIATPGDVHEIGKSPGFPLRDLQSLFVNQ